MHRKEIQIHTKESNPKMKAISFLCNYLTAVLQQQFWMLKKICHDLVHFVKLLCTSYLVAKSSHTKPCCYLLLDFVSSMLLFFCGQVGILLNRLLQPPTRPRFNCTIHKYCNLCTYVNNANLNKRLAWIGRTTEDQVDEQFQNRETIFFPQMLTGQWTAIPLTSQIRRTQFSMCTKSLRYLFKTPSLNISLYTQIYWSLLSPPWKKDIASQNWRLYCDVKEFFRLVYWIVQVIAWSKTWKSKEIKFVQGVGGGTIFCCLMASWSDPPACCWLSPPWPPPTRLGSWNWFPPYPPWAP